MFCSNVRRNKKQHQNACVVVEYAEKCAFVLLIKACFCVKIIEKRKNI